MYGLTVYIEPKDILNKLNENDRERFNQCVFTDIRRCMDGSVEIECVLFNDQDESKSSPYRCKCFADRIELCR